MIKKSFRLNERQLKKGLHRGKPFFSYGIVANVSRNRENFPRFALVISGKVCKTAVSRNFFRRRFYDRAARFLESHPTKNIDVVCVVKKGNMLAKNDHECVEKFCKDLQFIFWKI